MHIDGTYRVNNRRMLLYIAMVEDEHGKGAAVAYCRVDEQRESIHFDLKSLLDVNPVMNTHIKCFIVNKDFTQKSIISALFPDSSILLCRFHILKTFRQGISKLKLPENNKDSIRQCPQSMLCANRQEVFEKKLTLFNGIAPESFRKYFEQNWNNCRSLWAVYITNMYETLSTKTNNRLERHN